ncbi:hypothetical protein [Erythrobacter crassostreae]|uniref:Uncharacterized protein n=1 Tax=Erythrobacter crassostreae TaxID=2828328 RepID=A0A9X1JPP8_9SPHN|nr:hypothetical protein [Erythrobacter crassostrea]MBV7259657.1 hypothetical protein [Erythrobacter crassostrea]
MIAATITILFSVIAIATAITLVDFWMRARSAYVSLKRQSALVNAGFVPQVEARIVRLRPNAPRALATTRPFARRLPRPSDVRLHALDAA